MSIDLTRARIIEVGISPDQCGILIRAKRGDPFRRIGGVEAGAVEGDRTYRKFYEANLDTRNATILAEFPLNLADLLPDGCRDFRFRDNADVHKTASLDDDGRWYIGDDDFNDLDELQKLTNANLDTIIPLTVHPDYVEGRR